MFQGVAKNAVQCTCS